jgi:hypothetical protein
MRVAYTRACCVQVANCQFAGVMAGDDGVKSDGGASGDDGVIAGDDGVKSDGDAKGDEGMGSGGGEGGEGGGSHVGIGCVSENAGAAGTSGLGVGGGSSVDVVGGEVFEDAVGPVRQPGSASRTTERTPTRTPDLCSTMR